jgi:hypothetical protein
MTFFNAATGVCTTGDGTFAERKNFCREYFVGHSANKTFAECRTRQKETLGEQ